MDDGNTVYDVEVQNRNEKNLGRRTRYYQGIMDVDSLEKGRVYTDLKNSVTIFLSTRHIWRLTLSKKAFRGIL